MIKRRNHSPEFKAKVALAALQGDKTIAELSSECGVHQTQITTWLKQLKGEAANIFAGKHKSAEQIADKKLLQLHAKIGELTVERDFLAEACSRLR